MAPVGGQRRKVVTVIFADVVGSTAMGERVDPETLRWAMQRWFGRMRDVVERHGRMVENYVGDAVMAVFGMPVAHEDDALRPSRRRRRCARRSRICAMSSAASAASSLRYVSGLTPGRPSRVPPQVAAPSLRATR
jgi:class 3 adenylate cyclase